MNIIFRIIIKDTKYTKTNAGKKIYFKGIHFAEEYNSIFIEAVRYKNFITGNLPGAYKIDLYKNWKKIYKLEISIDNGKNWLIIND